MNRLSGPRTTKYGPANECLSDYGISVNITHPLRRITFGATLKRGGNKRDKPAEYPTAEEVRGEMCF